MIASCLLKLEMKILSRCPWTIVACVLLGLQAVCAIVAGKYASEGDYPFAIVILKVEYIKLYNHPEDDKVICGGVLVTREHVFTGCHCVGSWSETSESSTVVWEPDRTAYDFNFSTPNGDDRGNLVVRAENQKGPQFTESTIAHYHLAFRNKPALVTDETNSPSEREYQSSSSSDQYAPTENPLGSTSARQGLLVNAPASDSNRSSSSEQFMYTGNPFISRSATRRFLVTSNMSQANQTNHRLRRRQTTTDDGKITTTDVTTTVSTTPSPTTTVSTTTTTVSTTESNMTVPDNVTESPEGKFNPFVLTEVNMVAGTVWIYKFARGQLRRAGNSFKHPRCNAKTTPWDYDFGIYRVSAPFVFDEKRLYPMKIYHQDNEIFSMKFQSMIEGGAICQTIGWGATQLVNAGPDPYDHTFNRTAVNMSEKLKHTEVKLVTDELCNELLCFPPYNFCNGSDFQWAEVGIVCAVHVSRGDSCDIDDGNALVCDGHVFGFANSGLDCMSDVPRFYTRLDYALDFYYSSVHSGTSPYVITSHVVVMTVMVFMFIKKFS